MSDRHPGDVRAHAIAQRRYFEEHDDWGYDPGDEGHIVAFFEPALSLVKSIDAAAYLDLKWTGPRATASEGQRP
jgi:hypothetical protein